MNDGGGLCHTGAQASALDFSGGQQTFGLRGPLSLKTCWTYGVGALYVPVLAVSGDPLRCPRCQVPGANPAIPGLSCPSPNAHLGFRFQIFLRPACELTQKPVLLLTDRFLESDYSLFRGFNFPDSLGCSVSLILPVAPSYASRPNFISAPVTDPPTWTALQSRQNFQPTQSIFPHLSSTAERQLPPRSWRWRKLLRSHDRKCPASQTHSGRPTMQAGWGFSSRSSNKA